MAQATALTAGTTAANSSDIVVTTGTQITLFSGATNDAFERVKMPIMIKGVDGSYIAYTKKQTNRGKRFPAYLTNVQRSIYIEEPGTYRVVRSAQNLSVGVQTDDGAA